jgi:16S rRNA G966 N2-methylase RsmD
LKDRLWELAKAVHAEVVADRRWLHQHPELSYEEKESSGYIAEQLRKLGHEPQVGIGGHGVKLVLYGKRPGRTIALRADMDALPVQEETDLPFASVNPGVMHACGHDCHVAMLLGAARGLTLMEGDWTGDVVLIFQPAEEQGPGGASLMIKDGVLHNPDVEAIFGLHINPFVPAGSLGFAPGPMKAATDRFQVVVRGRGGHGASPHLTLDPIPAAAQVIQALQHVVSRNVRPGEPAVVTVGSIRGGQAANVIPSEVTLSGTIDTSGAGLHRRGYRPLASSAPLRETLAAAMIELSYWNSERVFLDPFCGSGTLPIEAALIGANMAPGLKRSFAAEDWPAIPKNAWREARSHAQDVVISKPDLRIYGSDIDGDVLRLARHHAELAGVSETIFFQTLPVADVRSRFKYGCVICNPPYGERLGDQQQAESTYLDMRDSVGQLDTWSIYVLTNNPRFERLFGRRADRKRKLYNGRIEVTYYQFYGPRPPASSSPDGV